MNVLIATDGSDCAQYALREAIRLLPLATSHVDVVSVAPVLPIGVVPLGDAVGAGVPPGLVDPLARDAELSGSQAVAVLAESGVKADYRVRVGDPATAILATADELQADLVVVGSHGRGALGRLVLGSVSDAVAHRWSGATLVIRAAE